MCPRRSHILVTLTRLMSIKNKFKWMQVKQDDLEKNNHIVACDTLIIYPYSNETLKTIPKLACSN